MPIAFETAFVSPSTGESDLPAPTKPTVTSAASAVASAEDQMLPELQIASFPDPPSMPIDWASAVVEVSAVA